MAEYLLKTEHLTKQFKRFRALDDVSIQLEKGKIYGLIGKNGAGKTTLMRLICGLSYPSEGSIELFGKKNHGEYEKQLRRIGSLIEYPTMNGKMTALQNMRMHRIMRGIPNVQDQKLLELVGLQDVANKKVKDYSLGMRQRLGIAIALLVTPELLILDEPVNGLDPVGVVEIRNLIKRLNEEYNMTVLISSHNLPELYQMATDYIIVDQGKIKKEVSLEELEECCKHFLKIECEEPAKLACILRDQLKTDNFKVMPDNSIRLYDNFEDKKSISRMIYENGIIPTEFTVKGDTLENYFLSIIGGE